MSERRRFFISPSSLVAATAIYLTPAPAAAASCQECLAGCPDEDYCELNCPGSPVLDCPSSVSCPMGGTSVLCWPQS
jgi:hypothetical protein